VGSVPPKAKFSDWLNEAKGARLKQEQD